MHSQSHKDFRALVRKAVAKYREGLPFVMYRKPKESTVKAIFQNSDTLFCTEDFSESGFVFAPFRLNSLHSVILRADEFESTEYMIVEPFSVKGKKSGEQGKQQHLQLLKNAKKVLSQGALKKVVLSRKAQVETRKNVFEIFENALNTYSNALCYLWHHPKVGLWLGASPEILLRTKNKLVETVSLAGTLTAAQDTRPNWTAKEMEEQQLVTDFIEGTFKKYLHGIDITGPESVRAGTLWHLKSNIKGQKKADFSLKKMLFDLHPTPAVCGLNQQEAFDFIRQNENYEREYYTGFLGELHLESPDTSSLFVNLRCMQLHGKSASIYVGGGITAQSEVRQEWIETQHKSQTMLQLL